MWRGWTGPGHDAEKITAGGGCGGKVGRGGTLDVPLSSRHDTGPGGSISPWLGSRCALRQERGRVPTMHAPLALSSQPLTHAPKPPRAAPLPSTTSLTTHMNVTPPPVTPQGLDSLHRLKELYLYSNHISEIRGLGKLTQLEVGAAERRVVAWGAGGAHAREGTWRAVGRKAAASRGSAGAAGGRQQRGLGRQRSG